MARPYPAPSRGSQRRPSVLQPFRRPPRSGTDSVMPRFPKRLLALGGLAAGGAAYVRSPRGGSASAPAPAAPAPPASPAPPAATAPEPTIAPPPPEAPGPSVNPPTAGGPASETEREEAADAAVPEPDAATATPAPEEAAPAAPRTAVHTDADFAAREEGGGGAQAPE